MRLRVGKPALWASLVVTWLWPAQAAEARRAQWVWTAQERDEIAARRKQVRKGTDGFYILKAGRFDVRTNVSARFATETSLFMDLFYDGYCRFVFQTLRVPLPPESPPKAVFASAGAAPARQVSARRGPGQARGPIRFPVKPTVVVFASPQEYRRHFPHGGRGIFVFRRGRTGRWTRYHIYTFVGDARLCSFRSFNHATLLHEGTHCMLQALARRQRIPLWFNEGFAQLMESADLRALLRGDERFGRGRRRNNQILKHPTDGWYARSPSLTRLLAAKQWNTDQMGPSTRYRYAVAWNFMEFLFETPEGRESLRVMLGRLSRKERPLLGERECWALESEWHRYLRKSLASGAGG